MADVERQQDEPSKLRLLGKFIQIYWKGIFSVVWPVVLLPIFLVNNTTAMRCLYVVCTMAGMWITEAIPLPVTSLIPVVAFPMMGILDSDKTCQCYMKETNMMFIGGLIIAIAIEYCGLHRRIALRVMSIIGCSPRRLHIGLTTVTVLISMWISNTACTAMMCPILEATLVELEVQKIVPRFLEDKDHPPPSNEEEFDLAKAVPTRNTICNYLSIAYIATIGGVGTLVGTGTNLTFKGIYETTFPDSVEQVGFLQWMVVGVPIMLVMHVLVVFWMQIQYMGLFRPNSKDAQAINIGKEGEQVAYNIIREKLRELGRMSFQEFMVAIIFALAIALWFFRKPEFIPGWAEVTSNLKVKDSVAAGIAFLFLYAIPAVPNFIYAFSKDPAKRPDKASPPLLTWKVTQQKMHWGLVLLLGGGFALAEGSKNSGMSDIIGEKLATISSLHKMLVLFIVLAVTTFLTQIFSSNVAVSNIILPVLAQMSVVSKLHPMFLMWPATFACSYAYCLPISTPPNALVAAPCNMPTKEMIMAGAVVALICLGVTMGIFPFISRAIVNITEFPDWLKESD